MSLTGRSRLWLLVAVWGVFCVFSLVHAYRADASAVAVNAAEQHSTKTTVSCTVNPMDGVQVPIFCTVDVVDQSATPTIPTGTVTFSASAGTLNGTSCRLESGGPSSGAALCFFKVTRADWLVILTGSYAGDATHAASSGDGVIGCNSPPQLTGVTLLPQSFLPGSKLPAVMSRANPPVGTNIGFRLDRPARVQFSFTYRTIGRRVGGMCVAQTNLNRRRARCLRTVRVAFSRQAHAGRTRLHFEGRLNRQRRLPPGSYSLVITAISDGLLSKAAVVHFTVLRPANARSANG